MYKLKVVDIQKVHHQDSGTDFLDVSIEIVKTLAEDERKRAITQAELDINPSFKEAGVVVGEEVELPEEIVVSFQKHAFDPGIEEKELKEKLDELLVGYVRDEEQRVANAENDRINKHVNDLQTELVGSEISEQETKE
jgi:hypothetical protein